jgi:outer membrane receptor protein involved in Fe transport
VRATPSPRRRAGGESWSTGAYAEASATLGTIMLSGGVRLDHWQISGGHLFEQTIASGAITRDEHFASRDGWRPTARGGVLAPIGGGFSLRSAAYLGWRMPTLNELFRPFRAGADATAANPDLDPERLAGAEAGLEFARGPLHLSLTGFVNRLSDAIANVTLGNGPGTFPQVGFVAAGGAFRQRQNVDAVKVRGIEASAGWTRGPWAVRAGASFTRARMQASGAAAVLDRLRPAQTPNVAGTLAVSWERDGEGFELDFRRIGRQFDDDLNQDSLKGATTLDAFASWPLSPKLQVVVRAENLTNALVIAGIGSDGSVERATPRTLWIGLRLR